MMDAKENKLKNERYKFHDIKKENKLSESNTQKNPGSIRLITGLENKKITNPQI